MLTHSLVFKTKPQQTWLIFVLIWCSGQHLGLWQKVLGKHNKGEIVWLSGGAGADAGKPNPGQESQISGGAGNG